MNKAVVITAILILSLIFFPGCIRLGENLPPEPNLKASAVFIDVNETVTFYANDSYDRDGEIVKYYWDFDDGTNATGKYASHDYEEGGNYTVILIVTDDNNKKAVQTMTIHVNELPRPDMNISLPAYIHEEVYFQANDTYDPDGFVTDYFWDFGDGTNDTGMSVSHVYTSKGWFLITLTVTDNDDANAATWRDFEVQFRTYQVTWDTSSLEVGKFNGYNEEEESEHRQKNINVLNMTKLVFVLTWDDDIPIVGDPNDEFILNITSPDDETFEGGPSTEEQIIVNAPSNGNLNEIPEPLEILAESAEILEGLLAVDYTKTNGIGEWAINITLTEAGGFINGFGDNGNGWNMTVDCFYYYPVITKL